MFTTSFSPRFYETDAFQHINHTVVSGWFETAREPIFRIFSPEMDITKISMILARMEIDYIGQIYYGREVSVNTWVEKIGNSSFTVMHEAWQNETLVARGKAVQVYFNFSTQKSERVPDIYRTELEKCSLE